VLRIQPVLILQLGHHQLHEFFFALLAFAADPFLGPCDTEVLGIRAAPPILQV
jgi:hypothetical protein